MLAKHFGTPDNQFLTASAIATTKQKQILLVSTFLFFKCLLLIKLSSSDEQFIGFIHNTLCSVIVGDIFIFLHAVEQEQQTYESIITTPNSSKTNCKKMWSANRFFFFYTPGHTDKCTGAEPARNKYDIIIVYLKGYT